MKELRHDLSFNLIVKIEANSPQEQIEEYYSFLEKVNTFIVDFDKYKSMLQHYQGMKNIMRMVIISAAKMPNINPSNDKELGEFKKRFVNSILTIFNGIPFGKSRFALHIFQLLVNLGFNKLETLVMAKANLLQENERYNGHNGMQHC